MNIPNLMAAQEANKVDSKEFLNTAAAAKRLNVSPRTIIYWAQKGFFPGAFKVNPFVKKSPLLIPLSAIEEFEKKRAEGLIPDEEE